MIMMNIPIKVMNQELFWETLRKDKGLKLQRNFITSHMRILNRKGIRMAWGSGDEMESMMDWLAKPWRGCKRGDILAAPRHGGLYFHYAIYAGYGQVIHYAPDTSDTGYGKCCIHEAPFTEFLLSETSYERLHFSEDGTDPILEHVAPIVGYLEQDMSRNSSFLSEFNGWLRNRQGYHLYSAKETIERAESRIGEYSYNLVFNNCEHFALCCKTGIEESPQVKGLLKRFI